MNQLKFRNAQKEDLNRCYEIETVSYQGDEAASKEKILKRIDGYPQGFVVLEINGEVAGFVNSGVCHQVVLSDENFKELIGHDESGGNIVIMSVVVHPDFQGNGYAHMLMQEFIKKMKGLNKQTIHLICQTELIKMYSSHGFSYQRQSDSDHGGLSWHEMVLKL